MLSLSTVVLATALLGAPAADLCSTKEPAVVAAGKYEGRFTLSATGQGGAKHLNMKLNYNLGGTLRFQVGDDGVFKNGQAEVQLIVSGSGKGAPAGVGSLGARFTGTLVQTGRSGARELTVTGKVTGKGRAAAAMFRHSGSAGGAGGGEIGPLTFSWKSAGWCVSGPSGKVEAPFFDKLLADAAAQGIAVTRSEPLWTVGPSEQLDEKKKRLMEDLEKAGKLLQGGGEDLQGNQAFPRLRALAQRVRQEPNERLRYCLIFWFRAEVEKRFLARADQLVVKLNALSSDPNQLSWVRLEAQPLFVLSYELVELGLDDCKKQIHEKIVSAVTAKLKAVVDQGVQKRVAYASESLLKILSGARVQGKVAPGLVKAAVADVRAYHARGGAR
jgi:hypothetical protein